MTHEDLAIANILKALSPEDQSKVRRAAMSRGQTLAEYFTEALRASADTIITASERRKKAKSAATATAALAS